MSKTMNFKGKRRFKNSEVCGECGASLGDNAALLMYNGYFCSDACKEKYMKYNDVDLNYIDFDALMKHRMDHQLAFLRALAGGCTEYDCPFWRGPHSCLASKCQKVQSSNRKVNENE